MSECRHERDERRIRTSDAVSIRCVTGCPTGASDDIQARGGPDTGPMLRGMEISSRWLIRRNRCYAATGFKRSSSQAGVAVHLWWEQSRPQRVMA